jgi:glucose-1-phosphate adenylyltransferase
VILAGDHIYKMDYELMLQQHEENNADVTVACLEVSREEATGFGVMAIDERARITDFVEKPANPPTMPGSDTICLASMGIYVFRTQFLFKLLHEDAANPHSSRDFGKDIIPSLVRNGRAFAHRFTQSCVRTNAAAEAYWRDVGTVDAYWKANVDLTDVVPALDLYDNDWPIWTYSELTPPAKFVHDVGDRRGEAVASLVSGGCIISGASVHRSLLFTNVRAHSWSKVSGSVVMPYVNIARYARITNAVIDAGVKIPEGIVIGEDPILDAERFYYSEGGISLVTQRMIDKLAG